MSANITCSESTVLNENGSACNSVVSGTIMIKDGMSETDEKKSDKVTSVDPEGAVSHPIGDIGSVKCSGDKTKFHIDV